MKNLCSQSLTSQENRNQEKVTIHNSPPRSKIATPRRISIKEAIKQKSVHDSKCCYLCQREVSYGHKCSKCKRIVCTFPACCSIEETSNDILHICTACRGDVGIAKEKEKQPNRNKRKLKSLNESTTQRQKKISRKGTIKLMRQFPVQRKFLAEYVIIKREQETSHLTT